MTESPTHHTADTDALRKASNALLDAITFDDCGSMIGGKFMGGNGGAISRETITKADDLRRALATTTQCAPTPQTRTLVTDEMVATYKAAFRAVFDRWLNDEKGLEPENVGALATKAGLEAVIAVMGGRNNG